MRVLLTIALLLSTVRVSSAQTVEARAGESTMMGASGGQISLYFPDSTFTIGGGLQNGHFVAGATETTSVHGWETTLGDKNLFITSGNSGLSLAERGILAERKTRTGEMRAFVAACGRIFSSPYFSGTEARDFCSGYSYHRTFRGLDFASVGVHSGSKNTALESLAYRLRHLSLSGTGGLLESRRYLNGSAALNFRHFAASAARQTYAFKSERGTVDSFSVGANLGALNLHASDFHGGRVGGQNFGGGLRLGPIETRTDYYRYASGSSVSGSVSERISRHLSLTQYVTENKGHYSVAYGGAWRSNVATVSVDYSTQYLPLGRGFQQVLSVSVSLQLPHSTSLNAQTVTAPDGALKFSVYGGTYVQGPMAGREAGQHRSVRGKYLVRVQVLSKTGEPVEGIAVHIGKNWAVSNSAGLAWVRSKRARPQPVEISLGESTAPGLWRLISAPDVALPAPEGSGAPSIAVVERQ